MEKVVTKFLSGEKFSDEEIGEIMDTLVYPTTPQKILLLVKGMNRKVFKPDTILLEGVKNLSKKEDLIPICLALRYGANPNLYASVPRVGRVHILCFSYLIMGSNRLDGCTEEGECQIKKKELKPVGMGCQTDNSNPLLNSLVITLKMSGSNWESPAFSPEKPDKMTLEEPFIDMNLFRSKGERTVKGWLEDNMFKTIIPFKLSEVYPDTLNAICVYLDNDEYLCTKPSIVQILAAHSYGLLEMVLENVKEDLLYLAVKFLNIEAFESGVDGGLEPSFYLVSLILSEMRRVKLEGDLISYSQLFGMLSYAVERGTYVDRRHFDYFKSFDEESCSLLEKSFKAPLWKKYLKVTEGPLSFRLKKLGYRLNILAPDDDRKSLAEKILAITEADPERVKEAVVKRQTMRITSTLSPYVSFIGEGKKVEPDNRSLIENLYDYPDNDIVFYRDVRGNGWVFTRNYFSQLYEVGKNPYTNEPIPQLVLDEMKGRLEEYGRLFEGLEFPVLPVSKAIDELTQDEKEETMELTNKKVMESSLFKRVENSSPDDLAAILKGLILNGKDENKEEQPVFLEDFSLFETLPEPLAKATFWSLVLEKHLDVSLLESLPDSLEETLYFDS